jgi:hypothetical protein
LQGVWPFDSQCNILRSLTGELKENGFLAPETQLTVRFFRRAKLDSVLEKAFINDTSYYSDTAHTHDANEVVTWKIKDFQILYESVTLQSQEKMDKMKRGLKWFVDVPRITPQTIDEGKMETINRVPVPKGAKVVVLTWMRYQQLFLNETQKKNLSARFHFPRNAVSLKVEVSGRSGALYFAEGFKNVGTSDGHVSPTLRVYHHHLVSKGLYSKPFEKFFPPGGDMGFDQSIIVDFTTDKIKSPTELIVTVAYNSNFSPIKWYLVPTVVEQHEFTYHDKMELKHEVVV